MTTLKQLNKAYEDYELYYSKRRCEICTKLNTIKEMSKDDTHRKWLAQAIKFIYEEKR